MDKYVKLSQKSLSALAETLSARLRPSLKSAKQGHLIKPSVGLDGILSDLIAIPSVNGNYEPLHIGLDYVDHFLSERGMRVKRFEWHGVESLVATTQHTKRPTIMLSAHIDVVPAAPELFTLREKDGNYYGRGTFDMKFAIAAYLQLVDELQDQLRDYDFGIKITSDEETGGFNGVVKLIEEGYIPQAVVIPDGGDNWNMETFCKGVWHVNLTAAGRDAHGSRPWEGESATDKLMRAINEIQQTFPYTSPEGSTINLGVIHGGDVTNKVASKATASLDVRAASITEDKRLQAGIARICKKHDVELTTDVYAPPVVNDPKNPFIKSFMQSIKTVTGRTAGESMSYAATDGRHYAAVGVPCVIVRPPGGNLHGPEEHISKKGFHQLKDVLRDYLDREARAA